MDCYDTCVSSYFSFPVQSCADLTHAPGSMSVKKDLKTLAVVIEIRPPAVESNFYQLNKFCKYSVSMHTKLLMYDVSTSPTGLFNDYFYVHSLMQVQYSMSK